jgi:hypothetical protein
MFLLDIALNLSEWVLRAMPKSWQKVVEPDSTLGVAIGLLLMLVLFAMVIALVIWLRT